jgi:hypothetical protein
MVSQQLLRCEYNSYSAEIAELPVPATAERQHLPGSPVRWTAHHTITDFRDRPELDSNQFIGNYFGTCTPRQCLPAASTSPSASRDAAPLLRQVEVPLPSADDCRSSRRPIALATEVNNMASGGHRVEAGSRPRVTSPLAGRPASSGRARQLPAKTGVRQFCGSRDHLREVAGHGSPS